MRNKKLLNLFSSPNDLLMASENVHKFVNDSLHKLNFVSDLDSTLSIFDEISDKLCIVVDSSECIRRLHPSPIWKRASEKAFESASILMQSLNSNKFLIHKFHNLTRDYKFGFDFEKDAVIESFNRDFSLFRNLSDSEIAQLSKLQNTVNSAEEAFEKLRSVESLEAMIRRKFELARALGFTTPLEFILRDKHLKSFDQVMRFLRDDHACLESKVYYGRSDNLSLKEVFDELITISQTLFQIKIKSSVFEDFSGSPSFKFEIYDDQNDKMSNSPLGSILFDIWRRVGKDVQPTHYTIKSRKSGDKALVLIALSVENSNRLSFNVAKSIFHEFGHALHAVLSETWYQVLSGTRGPVDLAEIPSSLFEILYERRGRRRDELNYLNEMRSEIYQYQLAAFDQMIHHFEPPEHEKWSIDLAAEAVKEFKCERKDKDWFCSASHLSSYGGSYFSYIFSKSLAEKVYKMFEETGELMQFRHNFLSKGGAAKIDFIK